MPLLSKNPGKPVKKRAKNKNSVKAVAAKILQPKNKKKHKSRKHFTILSFYLSLLPRRNRLTKKTVHRLNNENDRYMIARGLDKINRLHKAHNENEEQTSVEEKKWREVKNAMNPDGKKMKQNKIARILYRAMVRKKRAEEGRKEELRRKKYRVNPDDPFHKYQVGYHKTRHRISKSRFMAHVDVPLFLEVLHENKDLAESPLWDDKLSLQNLSVEKAEQLKNHLYQFDVIVEGLKQGLFDMPGSGDFPLKNVRRKRKTDIKAKGSKEVQIEISKKKKKGSSDDTKKLNRRMSFPPFKVSQEKFLDDTDLAGGSNWFNKVKKWITTNPSETQSQSQTMPPESEEDPKAERTARLQSLNNVGDMPFSVARLSQASVGSKRSILYEGLSEHQHTFKWARKKSLKSFPPVLRHQSMSLANEEDGDVNEVDEDENGPFADFLTLKVPTEQSQQKKFIHTLVEKKIPKKEKTKPSKSAKVDAIKYDEDKARQRHERFEKADPFQRLHDDDKDSDIWSKTNSTTTAGYASWRRARDFKNAGNKQAILAHKVDTTLLYRIMLFLIIIWEIVCFVKRQLDSIYYWVFSSYIFKENIWLFEPSLFAPGETYFVIRFQHWTHLIISVISLSIIHRENECVSLLFAFSQMLDGIVEVGKSTHDYVYLPQPVDWFCIGISSLHVIWKVFIICLFIAYHYYCSGYIRKAREFKHRKTMLHNHEIKAKGTKGLQKRKMAWSWMTRHARNTQLRALKQKYSDIKDGNFPEENLAEEIRFSENKELRLYTQMHNLNIGFPYNRLRDMKRFVFRKLEKSDYTDIDDVEKEEEWRKKVRRMMRKNSRAFTLRNLNNWKKHEEDMIMSRASSRWSEYLKQTQGQGIHDSISEAGAVEDKDNIL